MGVSQPRPGSQTGLSPDGSLLKPVKELKDKFALLPAFLKERGLAKQHVESFDFFINQGIKAIIRTKDNNRVAFEADSNFYLRRAWRSCIDASAALCVSSCQPVAAVGVLQQQETCLDV